MAENTDATLEENKKLREEIEAVQQERRRNFADADSVYTEVQAREENERLKRVLEDQKRLLADAEKAKELAAEPRRDSTQVPYTITKDGPIYSTPNHGESQDEEQEAQASASRQASGYADRSSYFSSSVTDTADSADTDDNENGEN